jgi:hypothetical protein
MKNVNIFIKNKENKECDKKDESKYIYNTFKKWILFGCFRIRGDTEKTNENKFEGRTI